MSNMYSGTGDFPSAPDAKLGPRDPFVYVPHFLAELCPTPDVAVDLDVVPEARVVPTYKIPSIKPIVNVPECQPAPKTAECVPFTPMSTAAFTVNGRRYFGNNLTDKAGCSVVSLLSFDVNTAIQWRVEWCDPNEDIAATIANGGPLSIAVNGGKVVLGGNGGVALTYHWPSMQYGPDAELRPAEESAVEDGPDAVVGYTQQEYWRMFYGPPPKPSGMAVSDLPQYMAGGFSPYGRVQPAFVSENTDSRVCIPIEGNTLPAYVYFKFGTGYSELVGTVHASSKELAEIAFANANCVLLATVSSSGSIGQQHNGPILQSCKPKPFEIFYFAGKYIIYVPDCRPDGDKDMGGLWRRGKWSAYKNVEGINASAVHPPQGSGDAWYDLNISINRKTGVCNNPCSVWAHLAAPNSGYTENNIVNINRCTVDVIKREYSQTFKDEELWYSSLVKVGRIASDGSIEQMHVGVINQNVAPVCDDDMPGIRKFISRKDGKPEYRSLSSSKLKPMLLAGAKAEGDSDDDDDGQALGLRGFREADPDVLFESVPSASDKTKEVMIPARYLRKAEDAAEGEDKDSDYVDLVWYRLDDLIQPQLWDARFPNVQKFEMDAEPKAGELSIYVGNGPCSRDLASGEVYEVEQTSEDSETPETDWRTLPLVVGKYYLSINAEKKAEIVTEEPDVGIEIGEVVGIGIDAKWKKKFGDVFTFNAGGPWTLHITNTKGGAESGGTSTCTITNAVVRRGVLLHWIGDIEEVALDGKHVAAKISLDASRVTSGDIEIVSNDNLSNVSQTSFDPQAEFVFLPLAVLSGEKGSYAVSMRYNTIDLPVYV